MIITEGKTDVVYLKAALKKMWKDYPELLNKSGKGQFEYKVSFFKRSKRIEYFLNIKIDGADTLNNIMEFYMDKGNPKYPKYMKQFKEISKRNHTNSIIILFDNEFAEQGSPVSKFSGKWLKGDQQESLKKNNWVHVKDNLYMVITPLIHEQDKTDIEMLFDEKVQNIEIDGRTLDKTGKKDKTKYFNKDIFSQYIMKNYESIDFENFKPMLDDFRRIMASYRIYQKEWNVF